MTYDRYIMEQRERARQQMGMTTDQAIRTIQSQGSPAASKPFPYGIVAGVLLVAGGAYYLYKKAGQ